MVWHSHLLKNFPQFVLIHIVNGSGIVNKAEVDIFLEFRELHLLSPQRSRRPQASCQSGGAPALRPGPSPLRGTLGSSLRSSAEGEGHQGFPPPPDKDLESPSSTRLEALVPSRDSRARTRSPSPRAWPLEKEKATHSSILAWRIPGTV